MVILALAHQPQIILLVVEKDHVQHPQDLTDHLSLLVTTPTLIGVVHRVLTVEDESQHHQLSRTTSLVYLDCHRILENKHLRIFIVNLVRLKTLN